MSRGRKPGFQMSEEHRVKIKNSNILNALIEHVEGKRDMSASQVSAGLGLLKKVMPDLQSVEMDVSAEMEHSGSIAVVDRPPHETREEWLARRQREMNNVGASTGAAS